MATRDDGDLRQRAERALRASRWREALTLYAQLLEKVEVYDARRYEAWLEGALTAYQALGRTREAGYVLLCLRRYADAQRHFPPAERPLEWALAASGLGRHAEAARVLSETGHPVLAAFELEAAGAHTAARLEWERVVRDGRLVGQPYEMALAHLRLGQSLLRTGEVTAGARELATTQRLLEAVADDAETRGEIERALDCYRFLIRLGRETGSFENVAEGYLNSIRILVREDEKFYAFQFYDDFLSFAVEKKEWYAAATLAREAAAYSVKTGLVFERHYLARAAELWESTATSNEAAGGPVDLSENALHAAIDAALSLNDHALVARLYGALATLPLPPKKRARYQRLAARPAGILAAPAPPAPGFPEYLRRANAYTDVSRQDLVEWALEGEPTAVLARVLTGVDAERAGDTSFEERKVARLALRAILLATAPGFSPDDARATAELALALGRVAYYPIMRPLERLAEHPAPEVRSAVMASVRDNYLPRSLRIVQRGLTDPSALVSEEALRSLRWLGFRDGFDALARVYREAKEEKVRLVVLEAMVRIGSFEAGLFLLDVVRQEGGALAAAAAERLADFQGDELVPVVRQALEVETTDRRTTLEKILARLLGPGR
jgi:hypothetical protein